LQKDHGVASAEGKKSFRDWRQFRGLVVLVASRLLIADDNATVRRMLRALLETHEGWQVCGEAENGLDAVAKAKELQPDLILLDLAMPVMDGLRATREIAATLPAVPILIHTLHNAPGVELEAKKAGARKIINKTEDADELLRAIEEALDAAKQQRIASSPTPTLAPEVKAAASGAGNGSSEIAAGS
jgi:DNA-binding NarL/FixJ family response regulator